MERFFQENPVRFGVWPWWWCIRCFLVAVVSMIFLPFGRVQSASQSDSSHLLPTFECRPSPVGDTIDTASGWLKNSNCSVSPNGHFCHWTLPFYSCHTARREHGCPCRRTIAVSSTEPSFQGFLGCDIDSRRSLGHAYANFYHYSRPA